MKFNDRTIRRILIVVAPGGLAIGLVAKLAARSDIPHWAWIIRTLPVTHLKTVLNGPNAILHGGSPFRGQTNNPTRFKNSKTLRANFGLMPRRIQSDDTFDVDGHIAKCGDGEVRPAHYEAASAILVRSMKWSAGKAPGVKISAMCCLNRAVALVA